MIAIIKMQDPWPVMQSVFTVMKPYKVWVSLGVFLVRSYVAIILLCQGGVT